MRSIGYVFGPNWRELLALLEQAATDNELAWELVQNVHEPVRRDAFYALLTRHLHNYLASTMSLVDHVRSIMRTRSGAILDDYNQQKKQLVTHLEIRFVQELRNFTLHRTLPIFAHTLELNNINTPRQSMTSEVELNVADLLEWDGWSAASSRYLVEAGDAVQLRPLIKKHGELVYWFNRRIFRALTSANEATLEQVNELIVRRNAVWAGVDMQTARRMTDGEFPAWVSNGPRTADPTSQPRGAHHADRRSSRSRHGEPDSMSGS